ncbi:hypothetical protein Dimus_000308 [Dionaea muscipula]
MEEEIKEREIVTEMQRLKGLFNTRYSICRFGFLSQQRSYLPHPSYAHHHDSQDLVLVVGKANSRTAILNRPSSLNSLTIPMVDRLKKLYECWEENSDFGFVMMKVAILDGITMGAGAGVSVPGMFRVVTDKTVFSHPETQLGFHPDAGASFYLSRLPGYLGEYLALTSDKLNGVEMIGCGLGTHYLLNARLALIEERLGKLMTDTSASIGSSLAQYGDLVYLDNRSILYKLETIDRCFSHDTVEEIVEALEKVAAESQDEWCVSSLKKLKEASPLSLKVTLQSIREARFQPLDKCLAQEYRISLSWISKRVSNDFCEGVRARLVDKDFAPKWDPPSLDDVTNDMVDDYFSPLCEFEPELGLPVALREPYA